MVSQIANSCQGSRRCEYEKQLLFITFRAFPTVTFPSVVFHLHHNYRTIIWCHIRLFESEELYIVLVYCAFLFQGIICVETRMLTSLPKLQWHVKMFEQLIHILIWAQNSQPVVFKLTIVTMLGIITSLYVFHKGKSTFSLYSAVLGTQKQ